MQQQTVYQYLQRRLRACVRFRVEQATFEQKIYLVCSSFGYKALSLKVKQIVFLESIFSQL